jgi:RNA polymerase subunit RPABC4/transcription elongation factor Spt4
VAYFANKKGHNAVAWFFIAFVISPLLAGIVLALTKDEKITERINGVERKAENLHTEMGYNQKYNDLRADLISRQLNTQLVSGQPELLGNRSPQVQQLSGIVVCANCKGTYSQSVNFCPSCGVLNPRFTKCPNCGHLSASNSQYCGGCGQKLQTLPVCAKCGEISSKKDQLFCARCGGSLKTSPTS